MKKKAKRLRRSIRYAMGILGFTFMFFSFRFVPEKLILPIGRSLGSLAYGLSARYRRRVKENLRIAHGDGLSSAETRRIGRRVFENQGMVIAELVSFVWHSDDLQRFSARTPIEGKEHLDEALSRGKGVIALGAHLNNFFLLGSRLSAEGYPFFLIQRYPRNPWIAKKMRDYTMRAGQTPVPPEPRLESVKRSIQCLRKNQILFLVADERQKGGETAVLFFGRPALTATGPAVLSFRTGARIIPMFLIRQEDLRNRLVICPPVSAPGTGDRQKDVINLTQACTKVIEDHVRHYPEQWAWVNKRWKGAMPQDQSSLVHEGTPLRNG
jgi:KDO2-lipid IV(A) lauroyltransferase